MFQIDKAGAFPIPSGRWEKFPWAEMEVGESFFVPSKSPNGLRGAASNAGKRLGRKFITRSVDGGSRAWRVE